MDHLDVIHLMAGVDRIEKSYTYIATARLYLPKENLYRAKSRSILTIAIWQIVILTISVRKRIPFRTVILSQKIQFIFVETSEFYSG